MSRRRKQLERVILPDPKYKNVILSKFINSVMMEGKKSLAEKLNLSKGKLNRLLKKKGIIN
jgi:small subunit ribosomal protein S7